MFLKSVEIMGFKSFADRTRIEFSEGISALLGPNGCGKSNVVDSVKWVLGEQSTKNMRAEKMEDVIFNGTETRKALNVAEVTLTIANEEGILDLDVPEVSIKRRLFRNGESEYLVNNTPVKLKELRELFFDTGIGKSAYSIMEQGKIDQVLSNKPEERRYLFEEAAGITKFKVRGGEADRKLARTEENMVQVENILREVRRSYDTLKKQSEKTLEYRECKSRIFELEIDLQLLRLSSLNETRTHKTEKLREKKELYTRLSGEIEGINGFLQENQGQVTHMESELVEFQKKLYGMGLEKENHENQIRLFKEQISEVETSISSFKAKEKAINDKIGQIGANREKKVETLKDYNDRLEEITRNISRLEETIAGCDNSIKKNEEEISGLDNESISLESDRDKLGEDLRVLTDDIVSQLDKGLRETGFSRSRRESLEERVREISATSRVQIAGRIQIINDALRVGGGKDLKKMLESCVTLLGDSRDSFAELEKVFKEYTDTNPDFLDEFLAPEGIITRKRDIDNRISAVLEKVKLNRERIKNLQNENKALLQKIDDYKQSLEEQKVSVATIKTQVDAVNDSLKVLEREMEEQQAYLKDNTEELKKEIEKKAVLEGKIADLEEDGRKLEEEKVKTKKALEDLEKGINDKNKKLQGEQVELKKKISRVNAIQEEISRFNIDLAQLETEIQNLYSNFRDKYSRELDEYSARSEKIEEPVSAIKDKLDSVKLRLRSIGQVNLMAPEEFSEVKDRYDFLNGQLEDLKSARDNLIEVTREIKTESEKLFMQAYTAIRKEFHEMFRRLFGGGRAELKLVDPDNILESGIEIYAQPPGKKLENISLLSGGEKSLTGVGLLFATYLIKPSPFCILDEIDAALDEANIQRFVNVLVEFGRTSQFIVITHNKKTVTGASTLLGVTMQESGVSKIISIRLEDEVENENS
ncbi:chromosome segregation SMC family protein [Spirochaeta isovalerica]|uniref:Chromosome partition protein Smc n=1 Tax=Spirochaeta isovalerica TaxID=150 RepID=A0A841R8S3_9SPIO|nr:AAA family ATPase [Spirochaeta isovalerica]MBB6479128.1 chromosome segregation protein [Spirochaeta isovalerica]